MTNEQKATEIAKNNTIHYYSMYTEEDSSEECYQSAIEMANWKDEQFNMVCNWLRETNIDGLCDSENLASKFIKKLYEIYNG